MSSGKALEVFGKMIAAMGGNNNFIERSDDCLCGKHFDFPSPCTGYLSFVNTRNLGHLVIELGGGRKKADETLDHSVGLDQCVPVGQKVNQGDALLRIHATKDWDLKRAKTLLSDTFQFSEIPVNTNQLILESIPQQIMNEHLTIIDHPLVQHKLTLMRKKETPSSSFRQLLWEISMLLAYEVTQDLQKISVETPLCRTHSPLLSGKKLALVSILRAGNGLLDGILELIPAARVGFVGLYRDEETLEPVEYYCKIPDQLEDRLVIAVDPMLATGNSSRGRNYQT